MLILDSLSPVIDGLVVIPLYHRGHLSLRAGTFVALAAMPPQTTSVGPKLTEVILSPIDFRSWQSLWRIEVTFHERQDVLNNLLKLISSQGFSVLNAESTSMDCGALHAVELVIEAPLRSKVRPNEEEEWGRMESLEKRIVATFLEDVKFQRDSPLVSVRRMRGLRDAWERFEQSRSNGAAQHPPVWEMSHMTKKGVFLPETIAKTLPADASLRSLLVSDTKERLVRMLFVGRDVGFSYARIYYRESPSALGSITDALGEVFSVITCLTRVGRDSAKRELDVLLYSSRHPEPEAELLRQSVVKRLLSRTKLRSLDVTVSYPETVPPSNQQTRDPQTQVKEIQPYKVERRLLDRRLLRLETTELLQQRLGEYEERAEREPIYERRLPILRRVEVLRSNLKSMGVRKAKLAIFVSYDFSKTDFLRIVSGQLKRAGCRLVTGRDPDEGRAAFRRVILARIRSCDGFLGVWTPREGKLSPWFLWELGAAQANSLPFRLLIQRGVDPEYWSRINPEKHHNIFTDTQFSRRSLQSIRKLVAEVKERAESGEGW